MMDDDASKEAYWKLGSILKGMGKVCIAYSGGVDSNLLIHAAVKVLGPENVLAATAVSGTYTKSELEHTKNVTGRLGTEHMIVYTNELDDPHFRSNPPDRCYICRGAFFSKLVPQAAERGFKIICDGANIDDISDHRPGRKAAKEAGVRSPLIEAGIDKEAVRAISRELGIEGWDRPSSPCLASRVPYGDEITEDKLRMIEEAESFLASLGFKGARVRHHGTIARIEVPLEMMEKLIEKGLRDDISPHLKKLGFTYICLDLGGYRMGSLNEPLE